MTKTDAATEARLARERASDWLSRHGDPLHAVGTRPRWSRRHRLRRLWRSRNLHHRQGGHHPHEADRPGDPGDPVDQDPAAGCVGAEQMICKPITTATWRQKGSATAVFLRFAFLCALCAAVLGPASARRPHRWPTTRWSRSACWRSPPSCAAWSVRTRPSPIRTPTLPTTSAPRSGDDRAGQIRSADHGFMVARYGDFVRYRPPLRPRPSCSGPAPACCW